MPADCTSSSHSSLPPQDADLRIGPPTSVMTRLGCAPARCPQRLRPAQVCIDAMSGARFDYRLPGYETKSDAVVQHCKAFTAATLRRGRPSPPTQPRCRTSAEMGTLLMLCAASSRQDAPPRVDARRHCARSRAADIAADVIIRSDRAPDADQRRNGYGTEIPAVKRRRAGHVQQVYLADLKVTGVPLGRQRSRKPIAPQQASTSLPSMKR